MTGRTWRYLIVGLVTFVIGLIATLPARIATGLISADESITISGVSGTVYNGRAAIVAGPMAGVDGLTWDLHPLSLLLGTLSATVSFDTDLGGIDARLSRSVFGTTTVEDASGRASAGWVAQRLGYTFMPVSGDIGFDIVEARFNDALDVAALNGQIRITDARWQLLDPPVELGRFAAELGEAEDGIALTVVDSTGPLALEGGLTVSDSQRYELEARLRARAGADERLQTMLGQLGESDAEGWYRVREVGQL